MSKLSKQYYILLLLHSDLIYREGCYTRVTSFTTDRNRFQKQMEDVSSIPSGDQENGLSALAFTAADTKLGWVRNSTFTNGKVVRRVLILVTDEDDLLFLGRPDKPRPRHDFKGDGTDLCSTSKPPTHEKLREVLEKNQMTVISLLAENTLRPNLTGLYQNHFDKIGRSTKYCTRSFVILRSKSLWTDSELKEKDGLLAGEKPLADGENAEDVKKIQPLKAKEIAELSEKLAKAGKYDELIKLVRECLKETDTKACVFGDPEGFNTLGF